MRNYRKLAGLLLAVTASALFSVASAGAAHAGGPIKPHVPGDFPHLINRGSGKCIDVDTDSPGGPQAPGARVQQYNCHDVEEQGWRLRPTGDGYTQLQNQRSLQCITVHGGWIGDNVPTEQQPCDDNNDAQKFNQFVLPGHNPDRYFALTPKMQGGRCLVPQFYQNGDHASIVTLSCSGDFHEHWRHA